MAEQWIVRRDGENSAPMSTERLKQLAATGELKTTDFILKVGSTKVVPVARVKGLYTDQAETRSPEFAEPAAAQAGQSPAASVPGNAVADVAAAGARKFPRVGVAIGATAVIIAGIAALVLIPRSDDRDRTFGPAKSDPVSIAADAETRSPDPLVEPEPVQARTGEKIEAEPRQEPAAPVADHGPNSAATTALTLDEIELLKLASRPDQRAILGMTKEGKWVYKDPPPARLGDEEICALLTRQHLSGGRGSQLALRLLACEIFAKAYNAELGKFDANFARYPGAMRELALQATGLALRGEDVPPPFSKEFQDLTRTSTAWFDRLRKSKARQHELLLAIERTYFLVTQAVEHDLMPAMDATPIPPGDLSIRRGPGGQYLELKYTGSEPLTNVVIFSLVQQRGGGIDTHAGSRAMVDLFNRSFGSTDEQATDAQRYLKAAHDRIRMPKYASKYIAKLSSGQDFELQVGEMERGEALEGNTSTFALYSDQGRITSRNTSEFPKLPEHVRPSGPNDAKTVELDENGTFKLDGAFARSNRLTTLKRKDDGVEQVFLIDRKANTTYTFTLRYSGTAAAPDLRIYSKHFPDERTSKPDPSTVIRELHAQAGRHQIHCRCPIGDLGRFTLTIREGAAPIPPAPARRPTTARTPVRPRMGR